jgi:hypothetical protein
MLVVWLVGHDGGEGGGMRDVGGSSRHQEGGGLLHDVHGVGKHDCGVSEGRWS